MSSSFSRRLGLVVLLAVFVAAGWRVFTRASRESLQGKTVIRFAHVQLESGMREAFDAIARDYMALHPNVVIEQIAVPRRTWAQWMETRLIGEDAPDLLQLVNNDPNPILRHFRPLNEWMQVPNPYNAGTPLEGKEWRNTFVAPLIEPPTYWPKFLNYYSAPLTVFTLRVYYNRELWREIMGEEKQPANYAEFAAACRRIQAWAREHGREVHPIAGARPVPPHDWLFTRLLQSQTQRMIETVDATRSLGGGGGGAGGEIRLIALDAWFRRAWSLRSPGVVSSFALVRELGGFFQPGFLAADREDAMFYFLQKRAVMVASGSWEYQSITQQAEFPIAVFHVPEPEPDDPVFGRHTWGIASEADASMRGAFALSRQSRHPEVAVDFLRYLTSVRAHEKFSRLSGWLPAVRGVEPTPEVKPFSPRLHGYPKGFMFNVGVESTRLWHNNLNLLLAGDDGVERFIRAVEPEIDRVLLGDAAKENRELIPFIASYDVRATVDDAARVTASSGRSADAPAVLTPERRSELFEAQTDLELALARARYFQATFRPR